jgi:hypothetical protein
MKRKLLFSAAFILIAWAADSCSAITDCKFCKNVTYENGVIQNSGSETEYCGADLIKQEAIPDVTVGALVTKVECR